MDVLRLHVLDKCHLTFTGIIPKNTKPENNSLWNDAIRFGLSVCICHICHHRHDWLESESELEQSCHITKIFFENSCLKIVKINEKNTKIFPFFENSFCDDAR